MKDTWRKLQTVDRQSPLDFQCCAQRLLISNHDISTVINNVYEDRKIEFEKRIESIIEYAKNDNVCRSRQLLRYFGETDSKDCCLCDVCLEHNTNQASENRISLPKQRILELLKDKKKHHVTELNKMDIPDRQLDEALEFLINEEYIINDCGYIMINDKQSLRATLKV